MRIREEEIKFVGQDIFVHNKYVGRLIPIEQNIELDTFGKPVLVDKKFRLDLLDLEANKPFSISKSLFVESKNFAIDQILDWLRLPKFNITHTSDTHSCFIRLPNNNNIIVHTGDLLPNETRGNIDWEIPFQKEWVGKKINEFKNWIGDRKFLFGLGNHDFIDPTPILRSAGIDAINITNNHYEYQGVRFYGFPYIPFIAGEWNYECTSEEMTRQIRRLKDAVLQGVDVLVAHCPPYGILDAEYTMRYCNTIAIPEWSRRFGNIHLANFLAYGMDEIPKENRPKYLLCGHVHEHHGFADEFGLTISQAATTAHTVEIKL
jgi:Icc-related predicted phosphoesterase